MADYKVEVSNPDQQEVYRVKAEDPMEALNAALQFFHQDYGKGTAKQYKIWDAMDSLVTGGNVSY